MTDPTPDWQQQQTTIAIADPLSGDWQYLTFPTWNEARDAINTARQQGKQAVFYDGATLPESPIN
jgi:hypothetical protein